MRFANGASIAASRTDGAPNRPETARSFCAPPHDAEIENVRRTAAATGTRRIDRKRMRALCQSHMSGGSAVILPPLTPTLKAEVLPKAWGFASDSAVLERYNP